jgi:hypothetical protein
MSGRLREPELVVLKLSRFAAPDVGCLPKPIGVGSVWRVVVLGLCGVVRYHGEWACDVPPHVLRVGRRARTFVLS